MRFPSPLVVIVLVATIHAKAFADTVTIPPSADACLFELNSNYNFGSATSVPAGTLGNMAPGLNNARALFKFDIASAIPAGSMITAASLTMRVTRAPTGAVNSSFALHSVFVDWGEGTGITEAQLEGRAALPGEVTWNSRFHGGETWGEPGGQIDGDFSEDPSATRVVAGVGFYLFNFDATGVADVQGMLDNPAGNFGWILRTLSEETQFTARRWATRENANPPVLSITFAPPVSPPPVRPPQILSFVRDDGNGSTVIRFTREAGLMHRLECKVSLADSGWQTVQVQPPILEDSEGLFMFEKSVQDEGFWRVIAAYPASP